MPAILATTPITGKTQVCPRIPGQGKGGGGARIGGGQSAIPPGARSWGGRLRTASMAWLSTRMIA